MIRYLLTLLVVFMVAVSSPLQAQEKNEEETKSWKDVRVGIGIQVPFYWMDRYYFGEAIPLYFPIHLGDRFMIEPAIYFHRDQDKRSSYTYIYEMNKLEIGLFSVIERARTHLYGGFRLTRTHSSAERIYDDSEDNVKSQFWDTFLTPTFGGEYFFSETFSLGGELGVQYLLESKTEDDDDYYNTNEEYHDTVSKLFIRFYLPGS